MRVPSLFVSAPLILKGAALEGGYLIGVFIYQALRYPMNEKAETCLFRDLTRVLNSRRGVAPVIRPLLPVANRRAPRRNPA